jgi:hypothetical protein
MKNDNKKDEEYKLIKLIKFKNAINNVRKH